ncbi:site-specific DNA-methyltransferase [Zoogloea oleivorans]|uniref:site-specific DNA-methyltransferase (adenine-specific) n=1 Tax=Zoogloea oleivorans TaxID=1552750 RepID=A0A6C2CLS1_9RHOO|nr:site-specific DNA-methyltransferase [Zoogloea oleivorans]TYC55124.1 site-specific DNA-methyltransferase [Zoogloea oleivorans]
MSKKQKLELTWIDKHVRPKLEPRILLEEPVKSYHAKHRVASTDVFDNRLIFGDNLLALKALEAEFSGKFKCVFIDPPYNTGSAFKNYDDGVEHSIWLSLMRDRLEIIRRLISDDGSLWITIDDNEAHYLKVLCDEVFGRANFVSNAIWQKKYTVSNDSKWLAETHDHVLIYARNKEGWRPNRLGRTAEMDSRYRNPDGHPKGPWKATPLYAKRTGSEKEQAFEFVFKNGVSWSPPKGASPRFPADALRRMDDNDEIWFGSDGKANPSRKTFLSELKLAEPPAPTIWLHTDVGQNHEAREEVKAINPDDAFATPKPERLLQRVLELATNPGDLVLDSFAGSGTTGAVAHKMGRRWIMVEVIEDTCQTHIIPRLKKVIDGEDPGGITEAAGWKGGGGFRYYRLAPSLLEKDKWGNWVINHDYNAAMLAEALCKLEGFTYAPSDAVYWQHGHSTERDFVYVTTASLTHEQLQQLADEVGPERSLLVLCTAFRAKLDAYPNLTVKKIPRQVLSRCEWGHDDYSLQVENLPKEPAKPGQQSLFDGEV